MRARERDGSYFYLRPDDIGCITSEIETLVRYNDGPSCVNSFGEKSGNRFSQETIDKFMKAFELLAMAEIYAKRIDKLMLEEDSQEDFHRKLEDDLCFLDQFLNP
tara:strand:- start:124 stop:438 length:315 start_codon:yes stop_codon:yes gene_type:complete